ncbi:tripartite motif-containing protein 2 isoform X6 [Eubalaena glacialis]|nr:tripartite motif-containing protein 2 isoform X6 [Eubalaena glacialis]
MDVLQRTPGSNAEESSILETVTAVAAGKPLSCPNHDGNVMDFYCQSCETAMCRECTEGEHAEHPTVPLKDVVEQHKASLQVQLDAVNKRLPEIDSALQFISEIIHQLTDQKASIVDDIHSTFDELQKTLNVRKSVLLMELEVNYGLKHKVLQSQLDTLLEGQESIKSCSSFTAQALNHGTETEVLLVKKQMSEKLNELADQDFPLHPRENDQLDFIVETEGLKKSIHNLGTILTTNAVASETVATGEGLRQTIIGQPMSVTITTKDKDGELCKTGNAYITAELSTPDGSVADGEILDNKNGTYEFLYTVQKEGDFTLSLRLYDQHIRGSPFKLKVIRSADVSPTTEGVKRRVKSPGSGHVKQKAVKRPASMYSTGKRKENPIEDDLIFRVGTKGRNKGEFTNLQGVAASTNGKILIADSNNQCVQIFSNDGQFKSRFGIRGRSPGQLQRPTGVAVHPSGDIIIADYDNKWVSIFSSDGKFKSKKKGLSAEEKRARMMEIFFETKDVFQLKDMEKIAPKEKGITAMSVKEVLQSLVDDGMVDCERIGTSNYYWAFPSKALHARKRKLEVLESQEENPRMPPFPNRLPFIVSLAKSEIHAHAGRLSEGNQNHANLQKSIEKAKIGRHETEERTLLAKELSSLRDQRERLKAEVEKYKECDPQVVEEIRQANEVAKEAANRWTDNIFAIKSWAKRKFGFEENKIDKNFGIPEDFDYID